MYARLCKQKIANYGIMSDTRLLRAQIHIPRGPSGSVSRVAVGTGGGTLSVGVGTIKKLLHISSVYMYACNVHPDLLYSSLLPKISWGGR